MYLYIVRHASALPVTAKGVTCDADRPLTEGGVKKSHRIGRALARLDPEIEQLWTSPLLRARQTADALAEELGLESAVREVPALGPDGEPEALVEELRKCLELPGVALVGHEPGLGRFVTWLLTGVRTSTFHFKKGGVASLEIVDFDTPGHCQMRWLLTPKLLRIIARKKRKIT